MKLKTNATIALAALLLAAALAPLWAQQPGGQGFPSGLLAQLAKNGWTVQEMNAFASAADQIDWSGTGAASPEAVALALSLQRQERLRLTAMEQAQIALQLALMTAQMRAAGFDEHDAAVTAVTAVRNALGEIRAWQSGDRHGELGQIIRSRISAAVRQQVQVAAMSQPAGNGPDEIGAPGPGGAGGMGRHGAGGGVVPPGNGR